ncbi:MAG: hypothetical protein AAF668_12785, partial [Pseudomonadota bacterium]
MLNVLSRTRRVAEQALVRPSLCAAVLEGRLDEALDLVLSDLENARSGSGDPASINQIIAPIRSRIDLALDVAEIAGQRTIDQTTETRTWFVEKILEVVLERLLRSAETRVDLSASSIGSIFDGVFILGSDAFARRDLISNDPIDLVVVLGGDRFGEHTPTDGTDSPSDEPGHSPIKRPSSTGIASFERAFSRLGSEFRDSVGGVKGMAAIFTVRSPLGDCVSGHGIFESADRLYERAGAADAESLKQWLKGARVVGGDISCGNRFLERVEPLVWGADGSDHTVANAPEGSEENKYTDQIASCHQSFSDLATYLKTTEGAAHPCFRTIKVRECMQASADYGVFSVETADRLASLASFAASARSKAGMVGGATDADLSAVAALCGFKGNETFLAMLTAARQHAEDALGQLIGGRHEVFSAFESNDAEQADNKQDHLKLKDLGFDDASLAGSLADSWASRWETEDGQKKRFAEIAPGLLTAFGETLNSDRAVRLFDKILKTTTTDESVLSERLKDPRIQNQLACALGNLSEGIESLDDDTLSPSDLFETTETSPPKDGQEFLHRHPVSESAAPEAISKWRSTSFARVAFSIATHGMDFSAAQDALETIDDCAITSLASGTSTFDGHKGALIRLPRKCGYGIANSTQLFIVGSDQFETRGFPKELETAFESVGTPNHPLQLSRAASTSETDVSIFDTTDALASFLSERATTLERLAFVRSRTLSGDVDGISAALSSISSPQRTASMIKDLDRVRTQRLRADLPLASPFDVPDGGTGDIDLILGILAMRHASAIPELRNLKTPDMLDALSRADILDQQCARVIGSAYSFHARLGALASLSGWRRHQKRPPRPRFANMIAEAAGVSDYSAVKPLAMGYATQIKRVYGQIAQGRPTQGLSLDG